jgi:demethylmenaquinone methyltransferase/2-methoxy-6-polyprenyl-1,4-benzoquinol methylase
MDADLRRSMLRYYDERASEYEDAYVLGTGTASIQDPEVFRREAALLAGIVERFARGRLVDLACGTGYWLPYYAARCPSITMIDQSPRMLKQCQAKVAELAAADRVSIIHDDVFVQAFDPRAFDSAFIGFLISHLTEEQEQLLFERLRAMLDSEGHFLVFDSVYSSERARVNAKSERQERRLNDGTRFEIYKRYIDRDDIARWAASYDAALTIEHFGTAFVAVSGCFQG